MCSSDLTGIEIVRRALEEPIRIIAQNAGAEASIVVGKVKESKDKNFGYNAQTDAFEDLVAAGVIDPTKVTRTALQNAASIAALLLTTECVVVEKKEKEKAPPMPVAAVAWAACTKNRQNPQNTQNQNNAPGIPGAFALWPSVTVTDYTNCTSYSLSRLHSIGTTDRYMAGAQWG